MTHSGQGDERLPADRPAHEGVVLPADGSGPLAPQGPGGQTAPVGGEPWGRPPGSLPPESRHPGPGAGHGSPPGPPPAAQPLPDAVPPGAGPGALPPPEPVAGASDATQYIPYVPPGGPGAMPQMPPQAPAHLPPQSYPQPPAMGAVDATQHLPPVPPVEGASEATQYIQHIPPIEPGPGAGAGAGASDATQYIPPVPPGMGPSDGVRYIQHIPPIGPGAGPGALDATQHIPPVAPGALPPEGFGPGQPSAAEPVTQYLPPVPAEPMGPPYGIRPGAPGERPPPAEFDSLFRTDGPGAGPGPAGQPPRFDGGPPPQYQGAVRPEDPEPRRKKKSSPLPVLAAVVVGCAVLGLAAGAVVFGGDDDKGDEPGASKNVAAANSPGQSAEPSAKEPADPVKTQAVGLDRLLADSNDSRAAVIRSVESIKRCQNLDRAAADLRGAAEQRRGLVTRLKVLPVDKLPENEDLTESLTDAWQASAAADDHYAAWATQAKSKKVCRDGRARTTKRASQANRASGEATEAKREASGLWNAIAARYDLTERRSDQL
ncbi:hypothetical protein ACWF94_22150 [Streptomyces sp. NPDC055078]